MPITPLTIRTKYGAIYLSLFLALVAYCFFTWPIYAGDTDLWFHLSGGRYLFDHQSIPDSSYFSFIAPPKEWVNYYWGFQALVYKIYLFSGYYGLVALRAIVYLATILFVLKLLGTKSQRGPWSYAVMLIFMLVSLLLIPRFHLVRPHMFSYLLIPVCLYILEAKPRRAFLLPLLTVTWVNLHGMEFPVILLISMAYLLEWTILKVKDKKRPERPDIVFGVSLLLMSVAIFVTPFGIRMLKLPVTFSKNAFLFIDEMQRLTFSDFAAFQLVDMTPNHSTIFNVFLLVTLLTFLTALLKKDLRISHLVLFIGGVYLLTRGVRFKYEFAFLALPLIKSQISVLPTSLSLKRFARPLILIPTLIIGLLPFLYLKSTFSNRPKYPFSQVNLPEGIATFLKHIDVGGTVLNMPKVGGYLQWRLHPDYKIFMDMQMSMFTDEDYFKAVNSFFNAGVLGTVVADYEPSFIAAYLNHKNFSKLITDFRQYVPVFFDDTSILYVNRENHPDIADEYVLRRIDPFEIEHADFRAWNPTEKDSAAIELSRIHAIYPRSGFVNEVLAKLSQGRGDPESAFEYANRIIAEYPQFKQGYLIKAGLLADLERFGEAVPLLNKAYQKSAENGRSEILKKLWHCYTKLEKYSEAHRALSKAINPFAHESSYEDIFNLASTSIMIGREAEGVELLELAYLKVPSHNQEWQERIRRLLAMLNRGKLDLEGIALPGG